MKKYKVFIDAGHGGKDSGAIGFDSYEKKFTLEYSNKLIKLLKNDDRFEVYYTRSNDITCSLDYRTSLANSKNCDIFISLHNNAFNSSARGFESFAFSEKHSLLCKTIHNEVKSNFDVDRGVKYSNFYVLKRTKMSACLLELGFIDNKNDFNTIKNKSDEICKSIYKGILNYFKLKEI